MESIHVLVVDDNELKRTLLVEISMLYCIDVSSASSGEEAVEALQSNSYDLVLLDYYLDDCTGDQVLTRIGYSPDDQKRPYFVLASSDPDACSSFREFGFDNCFEPPFEPNMLALIIKEMEIEKAKADRRASSAIAD